jgi:hypothetical protein
MRRHGVPLNGMSEFLVHPLNKISPEGAEAGRLQYHRPFERIKISSFIKRAIFRCFYAMRAVVRG